MDFRGSVRWTAVWSLAATFWGAVLLGSLLPNIAPGQGLEQVKAQYTKHEYRIPMRDGKRLFTAVYVPKDASPEKKYPILLTRTPYNVKPYGVDQYKPDLGPTPLFGKAGYIFAYQDVRGRWMSEGQFVDMRPCLERRGPNDIDESTDAWDTVEFLVNAKQAKHSGLHNGKVGVWGISYPGFYTAAALVDGHPAIAAASPQAPINDWFVGDDWHHNGALMLPHVFNFMATFGRPRPEPTRKFEHKFDHETPDGYDFFLRLGPLANANARHFKDDVAFWNEVMKHPNYDEFWKSRNLRPHLRRQKVRAAVMTVGGWFDAENLFGALETYRQIEAGSPGATNILVMGPWAHGAWSKADCSSLGSVAFNAKTGEFYREQIELPFFEQHLKAPDDPTRAKPVVVPGQPAPTPVSPTHLKHPEAWVFETGTNLWRKWDVWPPRDATPRKFYLRENGGLATTAPETADARGGHDEYVSDPAKPVPFLSNIAIGMTAEYMVDDQRHASRRPDVVVYQTPVLEDDTTVAGPLQARLFVSTSGSDSDWIVKLIDVYPDDHPDPTPNPTGVRLGGFQQLVRGDVLRGRFRKSLENPEPFTPHEPTAVNFTLPDICHTFRPGHRIMVQVQSTWFPLVDRNPQKFVDIHTAKDADFQKAAQRVFRTRELPSHLELRVLP